MSHLSERRIPSLDGLRAVSIALVLLAHLAGTRFFPLDSAAGSFWNFGDLGVRVFFVISGFLITGLLLSEMAATGRVHLGRFYFRRTLRIFPPYYVYLAAVTAAAGAGAVQLAPHDGIHAVSYTSNYYAERSWFVGHTWSLSVEEQFYLLWPAVLILAGVRRGIWIAALVVLTAPVIRVLEWNLLPAFAAGIGHRFETVADAIAVGCVLAGVREFLHRHRLYMRALASPLFVVVPLAALLGSLTHDHPQVWFGAGMTVTNVCIALIIDWSVTFHQGRVGRLLNAAPLVFVGWISYSLYLWQQPFLNRASASDLTAFPVNLSLAVLCALASYFFIERPSLALRKVSLHLLAKQPAATVVVLAFAIAVIGGGSACATRHGGPVIDTGEKPGDLTGTISGIVRAAGSNSPLSARRVTATEVTTGAKYEATTATNGGYTMKVPVGRYRLQVELRADESTTTQPGDVEINRSDLDSGRDFVIAVKR
jgi:peptidoglycan/LPS O-acetylase OafA/YrhL